MLLKSIIQIFFSNLGHFLFIKYSDFICIDINYNISKMKAIRGTLIWFDSCKSYNLIQDGIVFIQDGKIKNVGNYSDFQLSQNELENLEDHSGKIIMPGFVDTHVHYPQFEIIGSFGEQLLQWLERYTFPAERKFSDKQHAKKIASVFLQQLKKNGTTTCMTFATVFKQSVDAFFEEASKLNMEVIAGKVLMDRNCPQFLQDTPETGYKDSLQLIQRWHRKGRNHYAVTPRFAPTSSREQLQTCTKLMKSAQNLYLQTHANEDKNQVKWVQQLFPQHQSYMDVYNHYELVRQRSIYAHCIHFKQKDFELFKEKGAAISHCPDSNLFLGSGFYQIENANKYGILTSIGSDIGGGTSVSMLKVLAESYKLHKMNKYTLSAVEGFYLATLGGAKALHLDDHIGKIKEGYYADLVVLDPKGSETLKAKNMKTIEEKLFGLMMLGDDRVVTKTYIAGQ